MNKQQYINEIKNDIKDYIIENLSDVKSVYDEKMIDEITGNDCGSYTRNSFLAQQNVINDMDLLIEAINYYECDLNILSDWEACDVIIRMYLYADAVDKYIDDECEKLKDVC